MPDYRKRWAIQPSRVICYQPSFSCLAWVTRHMLDLDNLMRLQRDCDDDSGTYIGTTPALATAPELNPNAKLVTRHQRGASLLHGESPAELIRVTEPAARASTTANALRFAEAPR